MKIDTTPVWNHGAKIVTLQLTDEQYYQMQQVDFQCQWYILRINKAEAVK